MAKLTCTTITTGYASIAALNANFDAIETALENTLSRDGTSPNAMGANLDMDSHRIVNLTDGTNSADAVNLRQLQAASVATDLPSQATHANKVLKTDGTVAGWVTISAQLGSDLSAAADRLPYFDGASTMTVATFTAFARTLLDDATAVAARSTLGFPAIVAKGDLVVGTAADTLAKKAAGTDGYALQAQSGASDGLQYLPTAPFNLENGYLDWSVAGSVLTVAIKTWAGADPSATDPVYITFRSATAGTGSLVKRKLTAATSISINDTATLGTANSVAFRLWCVAFDDGGTVRLALINCVTTSANAGSGRNVSAIYPLAGWGIASATLEDNASDSAQTFYSSAAVTTKAYATLGYATWESGLATAGTWSAVPTRAQLWGLGVPLPGQLVQAVVNQSGEVASGATTIPADDTIPQNTEGDECLTQAITPTSAANALRIDVNLQTGHSAANAIIAVALFQDTTANALAAARSSQGGSGAAPVLFAHSMLAATTSATTFKVRAGGNATAGTTTMNGTTGARHFGGVFASSLAVQEIMG